MRRNRLRPQEQANRSAYRANYDYGYSLEIAALRTRGKEADCASTGCADYAASQASQHQSSDVKREWPHGLVLYVMTRSNFGRLKCWTADMLRCLGLSDRSLYLRCLFG